MGLGSVEGSDVNESDVVEGFVNDFVYDRLGEDVEFMSVVEAADEDGLVLSEEQLSDAHARVGVLLVKIRDHIFRD